MLAEEREHWTSGSDLATAQLPTLDEVDKVRLSQSGVSDQCWFGQSAHGWFGQSDHTWFGQSDHN